MKLFKNQHHDRPILTVKPKLIDTIMEVGGYIALIALWVYVWICYNLLPDIVPTHFGAGGVVDGYGEKELTFIAPVIATCLFVFMAYMQRKPHLFNYTVAITEENALLQYTTAVRMMRVLKMCICFVFIAGEYTTNTAAFSGSNVVDSKWMFFVIIFLVQLPVFWFLIKSSKNA